MWASQLAVEPDCFAQMSNKYVPVGWPVVFQGAAELAL